jgi:hypothetical protein
MAVIEDQTRITDEPPVRGRRAVARRQARRAWFIDGARNLRAVLSERGLATILPTDEDWYLCPLCLELAFTIEVLRDPDPPLTAEDASPDWFGGSKIALTCKRCNNASGTLFDSHAQQADLLRHFWSGKSAQPMTVRYTAEGVTNVAEMYISGDGVLLLGVPAANNRADIDRMTGIMDGWSAADREGPTFQISGQVRSNADRARASWIRAAYVVAFAALGWRYILQPALDPLRAYLRDPSQSTLPILSMSDHEADPKRREIVLVEEPSDLRCVFVVCGEHQIILPIPDDPRSLEDLSAAFIGGRDISQRARLDMTGKRVPWPKRPLHLLDPLPASIDRRSLPQVVES